MFSLWLCWCVIAISSTGVKVVTSRGFKSFPTTVKTFENDTVLLPCYVEDRGVQARVRWWREGVLLADSEEPQLRPVERVNMWDNKSLEVSHVQPEDTGEYVCQATRPAPWGHVTQVHEIEVMFPPSVHTVPESGELEVNLGEEVDMSCIAKGVPTPIITWRREGEEQQLLDDRPRWRFHADNRSLAGRYTCVASNGVGKAATADIDLRIKYSPEIAVKKTWVHASPGIRAQLDCKVSAWPEAKVEWYFKEDRVPYSSRIVEHCAGNDHSLVIRNVRQTDYGYYFCRASNSLGITESVIELSGVANPAVFKKESQAVSKRAFNFIWVVDSYSPIIEYQFWFRKFTQKGARGEWHKLFIPSGSDAIGPVHARSFNLTGLDEATNYEALVLSRNRFGWSRPSKILRFATEGAPHGYDGTYKVDSVPEEKILSVVQLASMSQHSTVPDSESRGTSGIYKGEIFLLITLTSVCTVLLSFSAMPFHSLTL